MKAKRQEYNTGPELTGDSGLINMNGRLYDPVLGRFLNADPVIQFPGFTQSYNSYSYVMNNPLRFTDPTGYTASTDAFIEAGLDNRSLAEKMREVYGEMFFDVFLSEIFSGGDQGLSPLIFKDGSYYTLYGKKLTPEEAKEHIMRNTAIANANSGGVTPGFDIDKAVDYINANAHSKSQGACSRYVQNALVAGGITAAKTQPVKAGGAYGPLLKKWGFTMITTTLDNYTPVKGDIGVIQGYPGGTQCASGPCGHIQMYNGTQWVSDYTQSLNRPFYPGPAYQQNAPSFEIYRWK
jgi:RHS repeat-associated protein